MQLVTGFQNFHSEVDKQTALKWKAAGEEGGLWVHNQARPGCNAEARSQITWQGHDGELSVHRLVLLEVLVPLCDHAPACAKHGSAYFMHVCIRA